MTSSTLPEKYFASTNQDSPSQPNGKSSSVSSPTRPDLPELSSNSPISASVIGYAEPAKRASLPAAQDLDSTDLLWDNFRLEGRLTTLRQAIQDIGQLLADIPTTEALSRESYLSDLADTCDECPDCRYLRARLTTSKSSMFEHLGDECRCLCPQHNRQRKRLEARLQAETLELFRRRTETVQAIIQRATRAKH